MTSTNSTKRPSIVPKNSVDHCGTTVLFEQPVNEQIRNFLRLETLFQQFERNRIAIAPDSHLHALKTLFEILDILERGDTRAELAKELARVSKTYTLLRENPDVDLHKLNLFLKQVDQLQQWGVNYEGKFGDKLRKTHFIESVKYKASISGGTCHFDSPDLFLFLNKPCNNRQAQLQIWLDDIEGVKTSIEVILRLLRENGKWTTKHAPLGSFTIETSNGPFQLLRLKLLSKDAVFPEVSCGRRRGHIHFMQFNQDGRKMPVQRSIDFELACCS